MRNIILRFHTAGDIDKSVEKVLHDLGNPEPPLSLDEVRQLLKLDLGYYSSHKDGMLAEVAHRMVMAGKQILARPTLIWEAIKTGNIRALYLYDRKKIFIDDDLPELKIRWNTAHEIGHELNPVHRDTILADNKTTLSQACNQQMEAEANYAAGQLLFLRDRFITEARDHAVIDIKTVKKLGKRYANTMTCTMWRLIEHSMIPCFGAITVHPQRIDGEFDPADPLRYFIRSPQFIKRFSKVTEDDVFEHLKSYCTWAGKGPLGQAEIVIEDDNGQRNVFLFESFHNTHEVLTIATHVRVIPSTFSLGMS